MLLFQKNIWEVFKTQSALKADTYLTNLIGLEAEQTSAKRLLKRSSAVLKMNLLGEKSSENLIGTKFHIVLAGTVTDFSVIYSAFLVISV